MREIEQVLNSKEAQKRRIRERYKGIDKNQIEIIDAIPEDNINDYNGKERNVAAYCRVSTDDPNQTSSYELQCNYYQEYISKRPKWTLVGVYADEGISGTSLKHREAFNKMIEDCKAGKIELIITKSVSRFARNIVDCIGLVRELKELPQPVGVLFETEGIYTLDSQSEMQLSFMATIAQEESHIKSNIMNASIDMRFQRGIFLTPVLLGYDLDEDGNLTVNEEEAMTVRLIFFMYLYGYTCGQIAQQLEDLGRLTKKGNTNWSPSSILQILQNERHCGDLVARKTWTPNYLDHKSVKNEGKKKRYRVQDHHDPIITRDDFIAVQRLIANAKYGNIGYLPELKVIPDGFLKGFVTVHTRWAAFRPEDYENASKSVYTDNSKSVNKNDETISEIAVKKGDFDFRGFQITRSQFFNNRSVISVTFSIDNISFGITGVRKLNSSEYVELLIHPGKKLFAVRPAAKDCKHRVKWCKKTDGNTITVSVSGKPFLKTIYEMFGWKEPYKYRICGVRTQTGNETVLLFHMTETELFIPSALMDVEHIESEETEEKAAASGKSLRAYPSRWIESFGSDYYMQAKEFEQLFNAENRKKISDAVVFSTEEKLNNTGYPELKTEIDSLVSNMRVK